jgi:hypothetical protein
VARKADQPSRKPVNRWTTKEMSHLVIPNLRADPEKHRAFVARYHEATGYDYNEKMPLDHALCLITGLDRPSRAWEKAKQYLTYGIATFPQCDPKAIREAGEALKVWDRAEIKYLLRPFSDKESEQYLNQYKDGLTSWQYLHLAGWLAEAKESLRTAASKKSLGGNLGVTPAQRQKEQAKAPPKNN